MTDDEPKPIDLDEDDPSWEAAWRRACTMASEIYAERWHALVTKMARRTRK